MKKLLLILSLVAATSFTAFAQKPVAGAKGFTFGLNAPFNVATTQSVNSGPARTGTLLFRYYIKDGLAARVSVNYTRSGQTVTDTATAGVETETKTKSNTIALQLGAQKSLGEGEKLEPYVGADLYFARTGRKYTQMSEVVSTAGGTVGDYTEVTANGNPDGFGGYDGGTSSIGLIPMVGFNYFFAENFAIGAEFGWGLIRTSTNKKPVEVVTESKAGATTTTTTVWYNSDNRDRTTTLDTRGNGTITVSVFF